MSRKCQNDGWTLIEMLIAVPVAAIAFLLIFSIIWGGTRLIARNFAINFAHMNFVSPMQRLTDDVHMAIVSPQLTQTLAAGATGTVPAGYSGGGTKAWSRGKMTSWNLPVVTGSGPAAGMRLYLMAATTVNVTTSGTYNVTKAGYPVASGSYAANSSTIGIEIATSDEQTLFSNAPQGMHLCIPSAPILVSSTNYAMLDGKITAVSFTGSLGAGGTASTLVANCTLSGTLGYLLQSWGTRVGYTSNTMTTLAYLVAPISYFVCGTDLVRLNYDGNWEVVMRNVLPTNTNWTVAQPFSMPWPYTKSFLSNAADGQRAVSLRLAGTNPDYATDINATSAVNNRFRGANADMLLYDIVLWSRMPTFDEMAR